MQFYVYNNNYYYCLMLTIFIVAQQASTFTSNLVLHVQQAMHADVSILTEIEDEDLHQCGRCRAMFSRLADYFSHKQCGTCQKYLDSAAQTSVPASLTDDAHSEDCRETVELESIVRQASSGEDGEMVVHSELCTSACGGLSTVAATGGHIVSPGDDGDAASADSEDLPQSNVSDEVSCCSVAEEQLIVSAAGDSDPLAADEEQCVDNSGLPPEAPSPHHDVAKRLPHAVPPPHQCPQCDFTSKFRDDFDQHLRRQHGLSCHVCFDCSRAFADAYKLRRHQRRHCTKTPTRKKQQALLFVHQQLISQDQHQSIPNFLALDKRSKALEEGGGSVMDAERFRCRMCSQSFSDYDGVCGHVNAAHWSVARPGICRFCGAWFVNPYKLRRHVTSSVHDDVAADAMASFKRQIDRMSIGCTPEALRLLRRARAESLRHLDSGTECTLCGQTFSARSSLLRHRKVIHSRRCVTEASPPTISCQLCGASFDRRRAYLRHRRDEHRKLPVTRAPSATRNCPVCDRTFTRADSAVRHHSAVHAASQQVPDDTDIAVWSLIVNEQQGDHHSAASSTLCFICAQSSPTRADHARHLALFHRVWIPLPDGPVPSGLFDNMPAIPPSLRNIDDALAATQTQRICRQSGKSVEQSVPATSTRYARRGCQSSGWDCPYCQQAPPFDSLNALYRHKVDYHRLEPVFRCVETTCRLTLRTLIDYESHVTSSGHSQASFICSVCNEHCVDLVTLRSHHVFAHRVRQRRYHAQSASGCASILCDQCGRTFSQRSSLTRHHSVVHKRESESCRRYACLQCDQRFMKREHLQRHVVSRHATARPYVCRAAGCGRAFKRKDKLQEHYRCHGTDRLFTCSVCSRTYRQRDGLRVHERSHSRPTLATDHRVRRRNCRRCPATFTLATKLAEHLRMVHGRGAGKDVYAHRCDICGKTFPRPERMRRHAEREHKVPADWSHRCSVCGKGFAGLHSYEVHVARHHVDNGCGRVQRSATQRRSKPAKTMAEASARVIVASSVATASCDVTRASGCTERQTDEPHHFNRFFVPSTPSGFRQRQCQLSELRRLNAQTTSLDPLHCSASSQHVTTDRLETNHHERRISFDPLPYLHHPARANNDYSYYTSGYRHHHHPGDRSQISFYPSAPTGFGYAYRAPDATPSTPRGCGLFAAKRTATASALPFGVQAAESYLGGPTIDRTSGLPSAFPSVMPADYSGGSGASGSGSSTVPLRLLATQPPVVPDPPSVGRWFDSVPTLLPPSVDASSLDPVRWPSRHSIDSLTVAPRYRFNLEPPPPSSSSHNQASAMSRCASDTAGPTWSSVERSCLLNCRRMESTGAGLVLGSRRGIVERDYRADDPTSGHRDAGTGMMPAHGMLSLLPPW